MPIQLRYSALSVRTQSALVIGFLALAITLVVGAFGVVEWERRSLQLIANNLNQVAVTMADRLGRVLTSRVREAHFVTELEPLASTWLDPAKTRSALERMRDGTEFAWIGFVDPDGTVVAGTEGGFEGRSVKSRLWFQQGLLGTAVEDRRLRPRQDNAPLPFDPFLAISAPVYGQDGALLGVLAASLDSRWATELAESTLAADYHAQTDVIIVRRDGTAVLGASTGETVLTPAEAANAYSAGRGGFERNGAMFSYAAMRGRLGAQLGWIIIARQPVSVALRPVQEMTREILVIMSIVAALGILAAIMSANRLSRPLRELAQEADRLGRDNSAVTLSHKTGSAEIERLSSSLHDLLLRISSETSRRIEVEHEADNKARELTLAMDSLRGLAGTDELTGLSNRRTFMEAARQAFRSSQDHGLSFSILIIDVDHFKRVNDRFGHLEGDRILKEVAQEIGQQTRASDFAARLGGEEFVVILRGGSERKARDAAQRIRQAVKQAVVLPDLTHITVSVGVARVSPHDEEIEGVITRADVELYKAKHEGRDRISIAPLRNIA